jgi:hypothetical protein
MHRTYRGSCHCGAVRFEAEIDLAPPGERSEPRREGVWWTSTRRCNCSFCTKSRLWKAFVPAEDFRLVQGADNLTEYRHGHRLISLTFCRHCGMRPFASADFEVMGGAFYAVNVACLDDVSPEELAAAPITYENGRDDDWGNPPAVTSYL